MTVFDSSDERNLTRRYHRQAALDAIELAEREREIENCDWRVIDYWQRDAQVHALLALSAVDS